MVSVPGENEYDVLYRATMDVSDVLAKAAEAKAAIDDLNKSANSSSASTAATGTVATASKAQEDLKSSVEDTTKAIDEQTASQGLLNKVETDSQGLTAKKLLQSKQEQAAQTLLNKAKNNGYQTFDQYMQAAKAEQLLERDALQRQVAGINTTKSGTRAIQDQNTAVKDATKAYEDLAKARQAANSPSALRSAYLSQGGVQPLLGTETQADKAARDELRRARSVGQIGTSGTSSQEQLLRDIDEDVKKGPTDLNALRQRVYHTLQDEAQDASIIPQATSASKAALEGTVETAKSTAADTESLNPGEAAKVRQRQLRGLMSEGFTGAENEGFSAAQAASRAARESPGTPQSIVEGATNTPDSAVLAAIDKMMEMQKFQEEAEKANPNMSKSDQMAQAMINQQKARRAGTEEGTSEEGAVSKDAEALASKYAKDLEKASTESEKLAKDTSDVENATTKATRSVDELGSSFKGSTAFGVGLAKSMDDFEKAYQQFQSTASSGFFPGLIAQGGNLNKQLVAIGKSMQGLDDPSARAWLRDTESDFDSFMVSLSNMQHGLEEDGSEFDNLSSKAKSASTTTGVVFANSLDSVDQKLADMQKGLQQGGQDYDDFSAKIKSADTAITKLTKDAAAMDSPDAKNAAQDLRNRLDLISVSAFNAKSNTDIFTSAVEDSAKKADDASKSWTNLWGVFNSGSSMLKNLANNLDLVASKLQNLGGGGGIGGGLLGALGGAGGAAASGLSSLISVVGSVIPVLGTISSFAIAIPTLVSGISALALSFVGLMGAIAPVVGILATFVPLLAGVAAAAGAVFIAITPIKDVMGLLNQKMSDAQIEAKGFSKTIIDATQSVFGFAKGFEEIFKQGNTIATNILTPLLGPLSRLQMALPGITAAILTMSDSLGKALAPVLNSVIGILAGPGFQTMVAAAGKAFINIGEAIGNILSFLDALGTAAAPYLVKLTAGFDNFTGSLNRMIAIASSDGDLSKFFNQMMTGLDLLGSVVVNLVTAFANWGEAAAPLGNYILTGIASSLKTIGDEANKFDFKSWIADSETFLNGLSTLLGGILSVIGALAKPEFASFFGQIAKDVGTLLKDLSPIVGFLTDIVKGALPGFEHVLHDISNWADNIANKISSWLDDLEKHKAIMQTLSDIFSAIVGLVVATTVISKLTSMFNSIVSAAQSGIQGIIKLLNMIPGVNIGGGGEGGGGAATAAEGTPFDGPAGTMESAAGTMETSAGTMSAAADTMASAANTMATAAGEEGTAATEQETAAGEQGTAATAEGTAATEQGTATVAKDTPIAAAAPAAAADTAEVSGATIISTITGIVGALVALFGAAVLAYLAVKGFTDPNSTLAKDNKKVSNSLTDQTSVKSQGGPSTGSLVANAGVFGPLGAISQQLEGGKGIFSGIDKFSGQMDALNEKIGKDIAQWGKDIAQWAKTGFDYFDRYFINPIVDFFTETIPAFFKQAGKDISNWASTAWQYFDKYFIEPIVRFFTETIPGFFKQAGADISQWASDGWGAFYKYFIGPIVRFFTESVPGFFKQAGSDIAQWATDGWNDFYKYFIAPIIRFFAETIPGFFKQVGADIVQWASDGWNDFYKYFVSPIVDFFTNKIPAFFKQVGADITQWATDGWNDFYKYFVSPIIDFFTETIPDFFKQVGADITQWASDGWNDFYKYFVSPIVDFFTETIPDFFKQVGEDITNWATTGWNDFNQYFVSPIVDFFTNKIPDFFKQVGADITQWATDGWNDFYKYFVSPIVNFFTGTGSGTIVGMVTSAGSAIGTALKSAINDFITNVINNGIIRLLNDAIGVIPGAPKIGNLPTLARGGVVPGPYGVEKDVTPALLMPGEFVIRKRAAAQLGTEALNWLNYADMNGASLDHSGLNTKKYGSMQHFADGGPVTSGGGQTTAGKPSSSGGIIGSIINTVTGVASSAVSAAESVFGKAVTFVLGQLDSAFDGAWTSAVDPVLSALGGNFPAGVIDYGANGIKSAVDSYLGKSDKQYANLGGQIPTADHLAIIDAALKAAGVAQAQWPTWEAGLNTLITRESGWNAGAVNNSDSNAAAGTPSEGLAQVIQPTFNAYHVAGTSESLTDPIANVAAAINYINHVYGGINNVQQANANLPPKGYAAGGPVSGAGLPAFHFPGVNEVGSARAFQSPAPSIKSAGAQNLSQSNRAYGVHIEHMDIHNPIPEQSGDSVQRVLTRARIYGGRG